MSFEVGCQLQHKLVVKSIGDQADASEGERARLQTIKKRRKNMYWTNSQTLQHSVDKKNPDYIPTNTL